MKKPIIGITLDEEKSKTYSKYPWYAARKNYSESIDLAGGTSIFLPHSNENINQYLNLVDGLVITGGDFDIDPKIYGKEISSKFVKLKNHPTYTKLQNLKKCLLIPLTINL